MNQTAVDFQKVIKLNTLCVAGAFGRALVEEIPAGDFPHNVLVQTDDFLFSLVADYDRALALVRKDQNIDLIFLDADDKPLPATTMFMTQVQEIRPRLPVVVFSDRLGDMMRHLLRSGASWHFTKYADEISNLAAHLHRQVFAPVDWDDIFAYYARDDVWPRIEPGLTQGDLDALRDHPEEQYIIKRLFANSDVVQIFRLDEGFSGSRIYTVKPRHQLKRILKIGTADDLEAVQDKQERLIQPRLFRQVGQIRGKVVSAQHLGGACYSLAGSNREATTLSQFLQDPNRVRKELLDRILTQIQESLGELYIGSSEAELRYWAPLYAQLLPPCLTLEDAALVGAGSEDAEFILDGRDLSTISAVPGNESIEHINQQVREGRQPQVILRGFEVAELDSREGIIYLHDTLMERYPATPLLAGKDHPILRFKVRLLPEARHLLTHPVLRRGKRVTIRGRVTATQDTVLADNIRRITGQEYDYLAQEYHLASGTFIPPLENIRYLLWEVGREDMIMPMPVMSPVIHGDLNAGNILVEANHDVTLWIIDFSEARPGHIYFDLAKLEVEIRTHVFFHLFKEMVDERLWTEETAVQFAFLIENLLLQHPEASFDEFASHLRDYQAEWYDALYTQFPLYFENLLYFIYSLRQIARQISPERFQMHYPVAVFFQSMTAIKYEGLNEAPWLPWAKRLALACALVHGKEAVARAKQPKDVARLLSGLRQRSAHALVTVGQGDSRKYLLQWNESWKRFNLVGGRVNNEKGDRDSFARALQRKLSEELGLVSPKDYRILNEKRPVVRQQFSRRQHIFKDYEFRLYEIELLPRHPRNEEEFARYTQRFSGDGENVLLSAGEIQNMRTVEGRPISETARIILEEIGEIEPSGQRDMSSMLAFELDDPQPLVSRGRVQVSGSLVNARFGSLIENVLVELLPRPAYAVEPNSTLLRAGELEPGEEFPLTIWLQPREEDAKLTMRVTYYDTRGREYSQILETPIQFRTPVFSLFHLENPYVIGNPLASGMDDLFVGREDVFAWMGTNLLGGERPYSMILYGQPKVGKTSTLLQLVNGGPGRALREYPEQPLLPIYINTGDLNIKNTGDLFAGISAIIARYLRNRGISAPAPAVWPANGQGYRLFDQYLDEVEAALPVDSLLVLAVDELDHLAEPLEEGVLDQDLFPYLHSLMQHRDRLAFVLAGSMALSGDYWQLVFNAGEPLQLGGLNRREVERLVREPVQPAVQFDDLAVEQIWRAVGGHPYLTQLICHRLISLVNQDGRRQKLINVEHVHTVLSTIIEDDDAYLAHCWREITPAAQRVAAALAALQGLDSDGLPADTLVSDGDLEGRQGLDQLLTNGLVVRLPLKVDESFFSGSGNGQINGGSQEVYRFAYDLLRRWVLEKYPLEKLKVMP